MSEQPFTEKIEDEAKPASRPEGSPDLVPFKAVPRRRKAELMRKFEAVANRQKDFAALKGAADAEELSPAKAALLFDLMADVEDMLAETAHDRNAYSAWAADADEGELMALFGWYVRTFQVGE